MSGLDGGSVGRDDPNGAAPRIPVQRHEPCRCGHAGDVHEHLRLGSDCAACRCERYRSTPGLAEQLMNVLRRDG